MFRTSLKPSTQVMIGLGKMASSDFAIFTTMLMEHVVLSIGGFRMTEEQKKKFVEDYYAELDRLYGIPTATVSDVKTKATALKEFNDGVSKMITAFSAEAEANAKAIESSARVTEANARTVEADARSREADARLLEAQARAKEAEARLAEVSVAKKQGWVRIGVDILKGIGAFMLFKAVYRLENDGGENKSWVRY